MLLTSCLGLVVSPTSQYACCRPRCVKHDLQHVCHDASTGKVRAALRLGRRWQGRAQCWKVGLRAALLTDLTMLVLPLFGAP